MQAVESETLILYHTDLRGEWPEAAARALARGLRYRKRLAAGAADEAAHATLAGIALALRALTVLTGRRVGAGEIVFAPGEKPRLERAGADRAAVPPDFSISHSGPWVGCAAAARGRVGFDVEMGEGARCADWAAREAALKACGTGLRALKDVRLTAQGASVRGEHCYAHALELFPGAAACVMSSLAGQHLTAHALALQELFAS
jgi:phosphopantetheinyl transferase